MKHVAIITNAQLVSLNQEEKKFEGKPYTSRKAGIVVSQNGNFDILEYPVKEDEYNSLKLRYPNLPINGSAYIQITAQGNNNKPWMIDFAEKATNHK